MAARTPPDPGRLVRVSLADVPEQKRAQVARRLREQTWNEELRPDTGYRPSARSRLRALRQAVELERAVVAPSQRGYLLPETAVRAVLKDWP